mgnify:CR=1 FL=1
MSDFDWSIVGAKFSININKYVKIVVAFSKRLYFVIVIENNDFHGL